MVSDALSLKSPSMERTMVSNTKLEVEKFDGTNNYGMCQSEVLDVLTQQELDIALVEKPIDIVEFEALVVLVKSVQTVDSSGVIQVEFEALVVPVKSVQTVNSSRDDSDGENSGLDEEEAPFQKSS
ncbi:hypothetical protein MRB53_009884 [Persea americana]|uniref:Uncharacterized protein n=1 Tax=Persea americana TaxID=3435 RepID=A0ACC2LQF1_PERAE|nr:hypothetical protein MRB53_009884 [Persea americana]